jgi:tetratricopeptide (TPR) repeat protein
MSAPQPVPHFADRAKPARNDPCPCGSGRKYKNCCGSGRRADSFGAPERAAALGAMTEAGKFLDEFSPLRQAMRQGPRRPAAGAQATRSAQDFLDLAARHEAEGRREQAIAALRQAVSHAPDNAIAHYNLGLTCFKAGRMADAIGSLRRAVGLQPEFGLAQFRLGAALQHQGHEDGAIDAFRAAVVLGTRVREAHAKLGDLLWSRDMAAAAEAYRRAADSSTPGRLSAAKALMAEEKFDEAVATLRRALALDPGSLEAEWLLGSVLVFQGELGEAVRLFERVLELAPESANAYHSLAMAKRLTESDRPLVGRMTEVLRTAVLSDTDRMKLEYALGKAYDDLRDYAAAMSHFDAANRIDKGVSSYDRAQ